jgi:predicted ATPase/DNA-binding CsgD family transcriptional regulator
MSELSSTLGDRLPGDPRSLIGRDREIRQLRNLLLRSELPILTITGAGGVGKTRVALAVATSASSRFPGGCRIVSLASLADADRVPFAIIRALGVTDSADDAILDRCATTFADQPTLLVIDNFEHVAAAAPFVSELVAACPELRLLVTSRSPLHLSGERVYPLPPLALPAFERREGHIARSPAVQLFVARAQAACPGFALTPRNVRSVATICHRLDGLPLAIELAAAWLRALPVDALLDRLDQRLPLLTGGPRDLPARLRTMRDAIAWSHDLLTLDQQRLFRRLAVFAGGFTIGAAERVASPEALAGIAGLIDASLLTRVETEGDAEPRFTMLETIREYAREQLEASGEGETMRRAHAEWLIEHVAGGCLTQYAGPVAGESWFADWDGEIANVQAALAWADTRGEPGIVLRLIGAMFVYWYSGRDRQDILAKLRRALAARDLDPAARARGLTALSALLHYDDDALAESADAAEEAIAVWQELAEAPVVAYAHYLLAIARFRQGDALAAKACYEAAIARAEAADAVSLTGEMYSGLGQVLRDLGDVEGSLACYAQAIAVHEATATDWGLAVAEYGCATTTYVLGKRRDARARYAKSLRYWLDIGDARSVAACLEGMAWIACADRDAGRAVRLLGAADALRERVRAPLPCRALNDYGTLVAGARSLLSDQGFTDDWLAGRALSVAEAAAEALTLTGERTNGASRGAPLNGQIPCGLTDRELDVLRLVAEGHANPAIAAMLFISRRTVGHHIASILRKLDVPNRSGAVAAASRQGLL